MAAAATATHRSNGRNRELDFRKVWIEHGRDDKSTGS